MGDAVTTTKTREFIDIVACARCAKNHEAVEIHRFSVNPIDDYAYWATCPTNNEPILVRVEFVQDGELH